MARSSRRWGCGCSRGEAARPYDPPVPDTPNACAGPFGAVYDFYIERPWLMRAIGHAVWGVDTAPLYEAMAPIRNAGAGMTILDVPCGGGVAFRALSTGQDVRYIAADLDDAMLERARRRAQTRGLDQIEFTKADMTALPFADGAADLVASFSGLHMVDDPQRAVAELARCLKPGGELIGTTFVAEGGRRQRLLFGLGARSGHPLPPAAAGVERWLADAGLEGATLAPRSGFVAFRGRKPA